jgi:hypothetical protein
MPDLFESMNKVLEDRISVMAGRIKKAKEAVAKELAKRRRRLKALKKDSDLEENLIPLLGEIGDDEIAKTLDVSINTIRSLRCRLRIKPYNESDKIGEIVDKLGGLEFGKEK